MVEQPVSTMAAINIMHANTLLCNVELEVAMVLQNDRYTVGGWVLYYQDEDGPAIKVYQHQRSMWRAAWKMYRERTGD